MSAVLPTLAPESAAPYHPAVYAEVLDELSHTVRQLVLAALARAQPLPATRPSASRLDESTPASRVDPARTALLSPREREVLQRVAAGDSNKLIARALRLSPHTVKRHVSNILVKLELQSRGQAAAWWLAQRPQATR